MAGALAFLLVPACSTDGDSADGDAPPMTYLDGGQDQFVIEAGALHDATTKADSGLSDLCGVGLCVPDEPAACADFDGGYPGPGDGGAGGEQNDAGADGGGSLDASADAADLAEAGARDGGDAGASDAALTEETDAPLSPTLAPPQGSYSEPTFACQVRSEGGDLVRACSPAGRGRRGAPCTSSRDCAGGFACVAEQGAGQCLPYCCGGDSVCEALGSGDSGSTKKTFCAERPLRSDLSSGSGAPSLSVPVCVPADQCSLSESYPCNAGAGKACTCVEGKACSIVRADGTTSCVTPGTAEVGEACSPGGATDASCAPGLFCVEGMNVCVKLCQTALAGTGQCGTGRCQAVSDWDNGFGLCVGAALR